MLKGWPSVLGKSLRPLAQGAKPTTQVPACQPVEPCGAPLQARLYLNPATDCGQMQAGRGLSAQYDGKFSLQTQFSVTTE